jgi:hypothetical protein
VRGAIFSRSSVSTGRPTVEVWYWRKANGRQIHDGASGNPKRCEFPGFIGPASYPARGRTSARNPEISAVPKTDDAACDAPDTDLAKIIAAWPSLPEPIRRAVLASIKTR